MSKTIQDKYPSSDASKGLWTRCEQCGAILYIKHLRENFYVCSNCHHHLHAKSEDRVNFLLDKNSWQPINEGLSPKDPLEFTDYLKYSDRVVDAQETTGLQDAIQTGTGLIEGIPVAFGVMEFAFMGGSMGSVVGEKISSNGLDWAEFQPVQKTKNRGFQNLTLL